MRLVYGIWTTPRRCFALRVRFYSAAVANLCKFCTHPGRYITGVAVRVFRWRAGSSWCAAIFFVPPVSNRKRYKTISLPGSEIFPWGASAVSELDRPNASVLVLYIEATLVPKGLHPLTQTNCRPECSRKKSTYALAVWWCLGAAEVAEADTMHHLYPLAKGDPLCPLGFHPQVRWPTRCKRCFR